MSALQYPIFIVCMLNASFWLKSQTSVFLYRSSSYNPRTLFGIQMSSLHYGWYQLLGCIHSMYFYIYRRCYGKFWSWYLVKLSCFVTRVYNILQSPAMDIYIYIYIYNLIRDLCVCVHWFVIPPASMKLKGGYTGFTLSICPYVHLSDRPSIHSSVCLAVDRIVSALYLQQYLMDPFHICTSDQTTSEGVSRVIFQN